MKTKKIKYYLLILPVLAGLFWTSCEEKEDYYDHSTTLTSFEYLSNDTTLDLKGTPKDTITLRWTPSKAADYTAVMFRVLFVNKEGGDFSKPTFVEIQETFGIKNYLQLSDSALNVIAEGCGIKPFETGTLLWKVIASNGVAQMTPDVDHKEMTVTRLKNGLATIPVNLYLTGSATPGGTDINKAVKGFLTDTINGVYEFVSLLKPGEFFFVDKLKSAQYKLGIDGEKLEIGTVSTSPETAEGVYRFRITCSNMLTEFSEVISVDQIMTGNEPVTVIANLPYIGNCVWEATFTAATTLPAVCPYKFRFTEKKVIDGSSAYSYWGSKMATGSPAPSPTTTADYYYVVPNPLSSLGFYRYAAGASDPRGKVVKTRLEMSPGLAHYTHSTGVQQ